MRALLHLYLLLMLLPAAALAKVVQSLEFKTYEVPYRADTGLRRSISDASPIRQDGKVFHGYTQWHVNWQFWWNLTPDGRCAIHRTLTRVTGVITLPVLMGAPPDVQQAFDRYAAALRHHEMGHFQFAQDAANGIDRGILALPPQTTCAQLGKAANRTGRRILDDAIRAEREYDRSTRHGRTQGVRLPD